MRLPSAWDGGQAERLCRQDQKLSSADIAKWEVPPESPSGGVGRVHGEDRMRSSGKDL